MSNAHNNVALPDPVQHPPESSDESWRSEHLQEPSRWFFKGCLAPLLMMTIVLGGSYLLLLPSPGRSEGATHSSQLQRNERLAEIEAAFAQQRELLTQNEPDIKTSAD